MGKFSKFIARIFQGWKGRVGILTLMLALMLVVGWVRGQPVSDKKQVVSCGSELSADDVEKFRPGRSLDDILKDLNWRGNFELATVYQDGELTAISYEVFGNMFSQDPRQAILWAIFINGKFEKFVEYPKGDRLPIKLGTFDRLTRAKGSPPLDMAKLMKEPKPKDRSDGDYGLMIAVAPYIQPH